MRKLPTDPASVEAGSQLKDSLSPSTKLPTDPASVEAGSQLKDTLSPCASSPPTPRRWKQDHSYKGRSLTRHKLPTDLAYPVSVGSFATRKGAVFSCDLNGFGQGSRIHYRSAHQIERCMGCTDPVLLAVAKKPECLRHFARSSRQANPG